MTISKEIMHPNKDVLALFNIILTAVVVFCILSLGCIIFALGQEMSLVR